MIYRKGAYFSRLIKEAVKTIHGRQYIDHFWYLKSNPESIGPIVNAETITKNNFFENPEIKTIFNDYYQTSYGRKDGRTHDIPEKYDEYEYNGKFAYFDTGNDYQIIERSHRGGEKEVVLDLKKIQFLKQYHATMKMTKLKISDDHNILAFGMDLLNNEDIIWLIKYIDDDKVLRTKLFDCFDAAFTKDNQHIVYTQQDEKFRPCKLMLHKLGTAQEDDIQLFEEKDESYYLDLQQTKDGKYFVLLSQTKQNNEVILIDRENPQDVKVLFPREQNVTNLVQHHHEHGFYILTNKNCYDYKVLKQDGDKFIDFYTPQPGEVLQEVDLFHKHLVLYFTKESESFIKIIQLDNKESYNLFIPPSLVYTDHTKNKKNLIRNIFDKIIKKDKSQQFLNIKIENEVLGSTIEPGVNYNYKSDQFQFHLSTPLVYDQVFTYNLQNKQLTKLQDASLTGKPFKREEFTCTRHYAPSKDGTEIPITLVHHKNLQKNRQNKVLLHSYGAYGVAQEIPFNIVYLNALEKGWVLAFAHIRGGNERGKDWHKQAILENKVKSIDDLLACAAFLIAEGFTHPSLLCGLGSSAGATTLGAAINMRPDIWKCAVFLSPFFDVLGSLLDETLPLTVSDYLEFGNPNEQKMFESILGYSPYDNLKKQVYPAIYISAGTGDFRAPIWNVLKYTEKLKQLAIKSQKVQTIGEHPLIVDISEAGHYGGAGAQSMIEERTRYMTFLEYYVGPGNLEITKKNLTQDIDERLLLAEEDDKIQKQ